MAKKPTHSPRPLLSAAERSAEESSRLSQARRHLLADWCKLVDTRLKGKAPPPPKSDPLEGLHLSPRMNEILQYLLKGDSEKQIASKLKISPHTVHTYVKRLHQTLGVTSRGELLAKFVK